jgi:hypothetical protein
MFQSNSKNCYLYWVKYLRVIMKFYLHDSMMKSVLQNLYIIFLLVSCTDNTKSKPKVEVKKTQIPVAFEKEITDSACLTLTKEILTIIKQKGFENLSSYIDTVEGVRFSPYAFIDTTANLKFSASQFANEIKKGNKKIFNWGNYDGSGEPILLSIESYFKKFVYDVDFLNAEKISLNKTIGTGNSKNNISEIYKGLPFTESYFSGFDKKYEGMDWRALRLVFKKHNNKLYLVAIIHDQWTI